MRKDQKFPDSPIFLHDDDDDDDYDYDDGDDSDNSISNFLLLQRFVLFSLNNHELFSG